MAKKKDDGILFAAGMAATWTDEYLLARTVEQIMQSYGVNREAAAHVLRQEKMRRNML